jgi:CheY-like chemotaxis protein
MKPRWLFVDDDASFLESLRSLFGHYSAQVTSANQPEILTCTNVTDALLVLQNEPVSLVVTDIVMPQLDGYQFLKLLQAQYPHITRAVLSGQIDAQTPALCAKLGADTVMSKPMNSLDSFNVFMRLKEADQLCQRAVNPVPQSRDTAAVSTVENTAHFHQVALEPLTNEASLRQTAVDDTASTVPNQHVATTVALSPNGTEKTSRKTSGDKGLSGALAFISIMELVQMLALSGRNSKLQVEWPEGEGEMYIFEGMVIHAACPGLTGLDAAYQLLSLQDGNFEIQAFQEPPLRSIDVSATELLMEAARLMDVASQPQAPQNTELAISHSQSAIPAQVATAPSSKSSTAANTRTGINDNPKKVLRQITTNIKAHRQITIIEEDIHISSSVTEHFPPAINQEDVIEVPPEPMSPLELAGVPREGLLELVLTSSSGEVTLAHESANPELRKDLLDFFSIKKSQLEQQGVLGSLVLIRLSGLTEECVIAFGKDASMFARFNRPEYPTDKLLGLVRPMSCLPTKT